MATTYDWSPFFNAVNGVIAKQGERNQYGNMLDSISGSPNTGFPAQDQRMMAANPSPAINPQAMQMLRGMNPRLGMSMLPMLLKLDAKENQTEYDTGEHIGVNPATGKPEKYVVNKATGLPQWTGISPVAAEAKAPTTREVNMGDKIVTEQWDGQKFVKVAEAPRYKPASQIDQRDNWLAPVTEAGPNGKPIVVRYSNTGKREVVEGAIPKPTVRAPGPKLIDSLKSAGTDIDTTARLRDTFKPEYGGNTLTGSLENFYLRNKPGGDDSGQAQWWQDYQAYVNGVRNKLFGAALTPSEQAEFEKAIVTPRMSPVESKKNLERQAELAAKAAKRLADPNVALGVDREVIEGSLGYTLDDLGRMNTKGVTPGPQANGGPPQGVDPKVWSHMTPEEKALWK